MEPELQGSTSPPAGADLVLGISGLVVLLAALVVISTGIIATDAVYGTRVAWLLSVAMPLLVVAAVLSGAAMRRARRRGLSSRWVRMTSAVLWVAGGLALAPVAFLILIGLFYGFLFVTFELHKLVS
jgi:hypothetical protein